MEGPLDDDPAWLKRAFGEMGEAEIAGDAANPRIVEYDAWTTLKATSDEVAWCAAFMRWVFRARGSAAARSFLSFGTELQKPQRGCVVVFARPDAGPQAGHVGLWLSDAGDYCWVLGGNQGNAVSVKLFRTQNILGFRWPA